MTTVGEVLPHVYDDLRRLAAAYLRRERRGHTLQATAIVHEAYLRLAESAEVHWHDRGHFVGLIARTMRQILVDYSREHNSAKRGGGTQRVSLAEARNLAGGPSVDLVALDDVLRDLAALDSRKAEIVELHFFGGLTFDEIASALDISRRSVAREMQRARAWLFRELVNGRPGDGIGTLLKD